MQQADMDGSNPSSCGFDPHPPHHSRPSRSVAERFLGKEEVSGSIPDWGSIHFHHAAKRYEVHAALVMLLVTPHS